MKACAVTFRVAATLIGNWLKSEPMGGASESQPALLWQWVNEPSAAFNINAKLLCLPLMLDGGKFPHFQAQKTLRKGSEKNQLQIPVDFE